MFSTNLHRAPSSRHHRWRSIRYEEFLIQVLACLGKILLHSFWQFTNSGRDLAWWEPPVGGAFALFHYDGRSFAAASIARSLAFALLHAVSTHAFCFPSLGRLDHGQAFGASPTGTVWWDGSESWRDPGGEAFRAAGIGAGGEV